MRRSGCFYSTKGVFMKKRYKMHKHHSKKVFSKHSKVHRRNVHNHPMRGGIRF